MLGKTVLLSANSQATRATTYQWRLNGQNVAGATNAALFITNLHWTNVGNYQVIISNALGVTVGSSVALAAVRTPLAFETNGAYAPNYTNGFRARLSGSSGTGPVVFYASSNLLDWVSVYTNPPVVGPIDFVNPLADAWQKSFYRAAEVFVSTPIQFASPAVNQTNQTVRLELSGLTAAGSVILYASTNLTQWNPIHTNPPTISPWEFFDTLSADQPRRYYRASESR